MASLTPTEDLFHTPDSGVGEPVQTLKDYGVGIDTHSRFIQVCVLRKKGHEVLKTEKEFSTDWRDLLAAKTWAEAQIGRLKKRHEPLHYCIESTGTYHMPVLLAWKDHPSVVNPLLANPSRRKTDVLDARLLAYHSITGLWPASYIPPWEVQELRCLLRMRDSAKTERLRCSNKIGNYLLRFGHTFHVHGAMMDSRNRAITEDLLSDQMTDLPGVCPYGLPESVKPMISDLIERWDGANDEVKRYARLAAIKCGAMTFPHESGPQKGKELMKLLQTAPGIGPLTVLLWLGEVVDVRRFASAKQVAAYCGTDPSLKVSAGKVTQHTRRKGNTYLHGALLQAASGLIHRRNEKFGQWGYSVMKRHRKGGYRKACGAVARRLAMALYWIHLRLEPFSYDGYLLKPRCNIVRVPISEFPVTRFLRVFERLNITDSLQLHEKYYSGLASEEGVGEACLKQTQSWLESLKDR